MKKNIQFKLQAKPENEKTVVHLYGDIVDEDWVNPFTNSEEDVIDVITPKKVREVFEDIENENIDLHLNSYGGSVFASVSIFNYLKGLGKNISVYVDGVIASGATLIAMAGNKIIMPKNTMMMIHKASTFGFGNSNDLRKVADTLEKIDKNVALETYKERFKGTHEELEELLTNETWLSAKEAFDNGLIDEVLEKEEETQKEKEEEKIEKEEINNAIKFMTNFARLKF